MKAKAKRTLTAALACIMVCMMFSMQVFASGSFSKSTAKLNAYSGGKSNESTFSSGSIPDGAKIRDVRIAYNVKSGTDPYTVYLISPEGTKYIVAGPTSSTVVYNISAFNGEDPEGTWKAYIVNAGYTTHNNIYPASTVTMTVTVSYEP